ncbi:hypothetical protein BIW11_06685 [Tropilaelaps mercedesae]|uniref:Uncharacterized protein n=1 Tax=Tropilaelaps mercedesae TaxID=418985 RepID=A0A1V9XX09_9ACAR|nr:hypothetical protein BIW11_06685 [Tropilaelaps mercedesae]
MAEIDKILCESCQKTISECLCPASACVACTRCFIPELLKVHKRMCGNLQETCPFCENKYFVRDRPVHRRNCAAYKKDSVKRLFYTEALEHWTPGDNLYRPTFDSELLVEYVRALIVRLDKAALESKRRRKALMYLRRRAQKSRFVVPSLASVNLNDRPSSPGLRDCASPSGIVAPSASTVLSGSEVVSEVTSTAVVPYVPKAGFALPPPPPPPPLPPPA